jgi:hypothetical protein
MAYLTKTPLGYYVNRNFILPTPAGDAIVAAAGRGRHFGYYTQRNFVLPTSSSVRQNQALAIIAQSSKKACPCHGSCGHCSGRKRARRLGWLGDDSTDLPDFTDLGPPVDSPILGPFDYTSTFAPSPDSPFTPVDPNSGVVYGPPAAGQPGSTASSATGSIASAVGNVISSIFRPSASTLTPAQQALLAQQQASPLTTPIAGIGLSPLTLGAIGLGAVVLIAATNSGRRR